MAASRKEAENGKEEGYGDIDCGRKRERKERFCGNYAMKAGENRIYIATMQPMDNECLARIENIVGCAHRKIFRLWNVIPV